jgi:hypothetical protein
MVGEPARRLHPMFPNPWFVDPTPRALEVFRWSPDSSARVNSFAGDETVRAEPFDTMEFPRGVLRHL